MSKTICVTPAGRLPLEDSPDALPVLAAAMGEQLQEAFDTSPAQGLMCLASRTCDGLLPPALAFWRDFARRFFHDLCQLGEDAASKWPDLAPPAEEVRAEWVAAAPPLRGLEYLTPELLAALWCELRETVVAVSRQHPAGPEAWLHEVNPLWHLLGRVTLHLAENKRDPQRPFAFLATYTHKLSAGSRLQHLPLGQALKEYAGAKDQAKLTALLEPVRRAAEGGTLVRELLESKALFQPQAWTIPQAYRFLKEVPRLEEAGLVVRVPDWWHARRPPRPQVQVRLGQKRPSAVGLDSMLDFSVGVTLDGEELTDQERQQLLAGSDGLVLLRGRWVEVNGERLQEALQHWRELQQEHADGVSFIEGMRLLSGATLDPDAADDTAAAWSRCVAGDWLRETLQALRDPARVTECQPGHDLQATLRPYQIDGVRWLWFVTRLGLGGCLADDMGLGKTVQVIDLLLQLKRDSSADPQTVRGPRVAVRVQPSLLIVPASLVGNWKSELARFSPTLRVFFAHRSECDPESLDRVAKNAARELAECDLVVTTYGLARRGAWLADVSWRMIVLDEAQAIKNATSAQTKAIKKLAAPRRVVLTGTPVENHLGDLWSLFDFCCPGLLGNAHQFKEFVKRLNKRQDAAAFGGLRQLVRPYILRRMKTDPHVVPDLPDKTEMRVDCGLSKRQAVLYERVVKELAQRLEDAEGMARRGLVLSFLMQLKQLCNHPAQYLHQTAYDPSDSGKFDALAQLCQPIVARQERMLVFTQFQQLTEPLAGFLATVFGRAGLVLHGGTPVKQRQKLVQTFQADDGPPFFVISVKAGGSGLNLTAASHVIHFDRWWNPAVENQATDRAFRIGQKKNVLVHKFVCRGTVEERIDQLIRDKQQLSDRLLGEGGETLLTEMSDQELLAFVAIDLQRAVLEE
jgi:non-specific serine/threonine protein kinase